jgi:protein-disulfide isomerase
MNRLLPFAIIVIVLGGAVAGGWYWWQAAQPSASVPKVSSVANAPAVAAPAPMPGAEPPHVRGAENAPVTLEEFGDFECPPCGLFYPILKTIEGEYGSRLRVIFREFPLPQLHPHAQAAAYAAEAAGVQGKFWEMHDLLYENQKTWDKTFDVRPIFEGFAGRIGLDVERFKQDQTADVVDARVIRDGIRGHSLGVNGTPTVFINGREIPSEHFNTVEGLRAEINNALSGTRP